MAYDGTIKFNTSVDTSGFEKSISSLTKLLQPSELLKKAIDMVKESIKDAAAEVDTLSQFSTVMQQMGFSANQTEASIKKLTQGIQGMPTTLDSITATTRQLAATTGDLSLATNTALALNNAFYASGSSAESASEGISEYNQMLAQGTVNATSWATLNETMGYALNKTAEAFGFAGNTATTQLYAAIEAGSITFDDFTGKLLELNAGVGGFADVAKTSTGGITSAWDGMKASVVSGTANIITAIDSGLSKTRFKSIENIISSFGNRFESILSAVAGAIKPVISNIDLLLPVASALMAVWQVNKLTSFISEAGGLVKVIQKLTTAKSAEFAQTLATNALYIKGNVVRTAHSTAIAAEKLATDASNGSLLFNVALLNEAIAAKIKAKAATVAQTVSQTAINILTAISTGQISLHTIATIASTAATSALSTAVGFLQVAITLLLGPIGIAIALVAAVVVGIIALVKHLNKSSAAYKEQKEAIKDYNEKNEELAASVKETTASYKDNTNAAKTNAQMSRDTLAQVQALAAAYKNGSTDIYTLQARINSLNQMQSGLNLTFDETTNELSMTNEEIDTYISLSEKAAKTIALKNYMSELEEQLSSVNMQFIEARAKQAEWADQLANEEINQKQYQKLMAEMEESLIALGNTHKEITTSMEYVSAEYTQAMRDEEEERQARLASQEDKIRAFAAEHHLAYNDIIADLDESKLTFEEWSEANKEAIEENKAAVETLSDTWGISTGEIVSYCQANGITVDEWGKQMDSAWSNFESTVNNKVGGVVNSFERLNDNFEMSAQEMLENLQHNKEEYARWEANMEEITRQLGPTAAAEFKSLGPAANDAMEEILSSTETLEQYREVFGVELDEITGVAIENWNDPAFIGAPSNAIDSSAQIVMDNTSLIDATNHTFDEVSKTVTIKGDELAESYTKGFAAATQAAETQASAPEYAAAGANSVDLIAQGITENNSAEIAAEEAVTKIGAGIEKALQDIDASSAGQAIADSVVQGVSDIDLSGVTNTIEGTFDSMSKTVTSTVKTAMSTAVAEVTSGGASITSAANNIQTSVKTIAENTKTSNINTTTQMMAQVVTGITSKQSSIASAFNSIKNNTNSTTSGMATLVKATVTNMMAGFLGAVTAKQGSLSGAFTSIKTACIWVIKGMATEAKATMGYVMQGMVSAMNEYAPTLYAKADEIAAEIAARLKKGFDVRSPSHVMQEIFGYVMQGMLLPMEEYAPELYSMADEITAELTEHLTATPDFVASTTAKLQAMVEVGALDLSTSAIAPALATGTSASSIVSYNYDITIESPEPISESVITREISDFTARQQRQLG